MNTIYTLPNTAMIDLAFLTSISSINNNENTYSFDIIVGFGSMTVFFNSEHDATNTRDDLITEWRSSKTGKVNHKTLLMEVSKR